MAAIASRDRHVDADDLTMIGDDWRVRTRLMLRSTDGFTPPAELGFGDLAEMVARASRLPKTSDGTLFLKVDANGRVIDADEIHRLASHPDLPLLI